MSALFDFLYMGGYAWFVWGSYAAAFMALGGLIWWTRIRHHRIRMALEQFERKSGDGEKGQAGAGS